MCYNSSYVFENCISFIVSLVMYHMYHIYGTYDEVNLEASTKSPHPGEDASKLLFSF